MQSNTTRLFVPASFAILFLSFPLFASAAIATNTSAPSFTSSFGGAYVGSTLTANIGSWTDSPTSYICQWKRNGDVVETDNSCTNASTFVIRHWDKNATITLTVTATNGSGTSAPATSAASGAVMFLATGSTPAVKLLDTLGVMVHFERAGWTPGPGPEPWAYDDTNKIINALNYAGIKHVRGGADELAWRRDRTVSILNATGAKLNMQAPGGTNGGTGWGYFPSPGVGMIGARDWARANAGLIESIEGFNEINAFPQYISWDPEQATKVDDAIAEVKQQWTDFGSVGVPVYSMSYQEQSLAYQVGNLAPWLGFVNSHVYPGWVGETKVTSQYILNTLNSQQIMGPGKPHVITEGGWWDAPGVAGNGLRGTSQSTGAELKLMFLLDAYELGVYRTYFYELLNELITPATDPEMNIGLFLYDGTPKQEATMFRNLNEILTDTGTVTQPGVFNYTLTGMPANGHKLLFQKSDGSYWLAIWDDSPIFNSSTGNDVIIPNSTVTLTPATQPTSMVQYQPTVGTSPISSTTGSSLTVTLNRDPIFIKIQPGPGVQPPTLTLTANPTSITLGGSATLTWSSTNTISCIGSGFTASGTSGTATVSPTTNTTYSITCTGADGTSPVASATVTVMSGALPDVIITAISYNQVDGSFSLTIKNQGSAATPTGVPVGNGIFVDGVQRTWAASNNVLAAGASVTVNSNLNGGGAYVIPSGTHTISATVDDVNRFTESNETNNTLTQTVIIGATADATAPSTPANLTGTAASGSQMNLTWTASTDNTAVTGYNIFRNGTQVGTSATNSFTDTGLAASTVYAYAVSAYDAAGNTSAQSSVVKVITKSSVFAAIAVGSRVITIANLNVRSGASVSASKLGTQSVGSIGTITGGPTSANGYTWWTINYDNGSDGWSIRDYLRVVAAASSPAVGFAAPAPYANPETPSLFDSLTQQIQKLLSQISTLQSQMAATGVIR